MRQLQARHPTRLACKALYNGLWVCFAGEGYRFYNTKSTTMGTKDKKTSVHCSPLLVQHDAESLINPDAIGLV